MPKLARRYADSTYIRNNDDGAAYVKIQGSAGIGESGSNLFIRILTQIVFIAERHILSITSLYKIIKSALA